MNFSSLRIIHSEKQVLCPFCRSELREDVVRCSICQTKHHCACWNGNGDHCSIFSCPGETVASEESCGMIAVLIFWYVFSNLMTLTAFRYLSPYFTTPGQFVETALLLTPTCAFGILLSRYRKRDQ